MAPGKTLEVIAHGMCAQAWLSDAMAMLGHEIVKADALDNDILSIVIKIKNKRLEALPPNILRMEIP